MFRKNYVEINLGRLQAALTRATDAGKPVDTALLAAGVISSHAMAHVSLRKVNWLQRKLKFTLLALKAAIEAVEKAGGKIIVSDLS